MLTDSESGMRIFLFCTHTAKVYNGRGLGHSVTERETDFIPSSKTNNYRTEWPRGCCFACKLQLSGSWATRTFEFPGWKCSLRDWKYFVAIIAACISRSISRIRLRCTFLACLKTLRGISQSEGSWHLDSSTLFISRTKKNWPSSILRSFFFFSYFLFRHILFRKKET